MARLVAQMLKSIAVLLIVVSCAAAPQITQLAASTPEGAEPGLALPRDSGPASPPAAVTEPTPGAQPTAAPVPQAPLTFATAATKRGDAVFVLDELWPDMTIPANHQAVSFDVAEADVGRHFKTVALVATPPADSQGDTESFFVATEAEVLRSEYFRADPSPDEPGINIILALDSEQFSAFGDLPLDTSFRMVGHYEEPGTYSMAVYVPQDFAPETRLHRGVIVDIIDTTTTDFEYVARGAVVDSQIPHEENSLYGITVGLTDDQVLAAADALVDGGVVLTIGWEAEGVAPPVGAGAYRFVTLRATSMYGAIEPREEVAIVFSQNHNGETTSVLLVDRVTVIKTEVETSDGWVDNDGRPYPFAQANRFTIALEPEQERAVTGRTGMKDATTLGVLHDGGEMYRTVVHLAADSPMVTDLQNLDRVDVTSTRLGVIAPSVEVLGLEFRPDPVSSEQDAYMVTVVVTLDELVAMSTAYWTNEIGLAP